MEGEGKGINFGERELGLTRGVAVLISLSLSPTVLLIIAARCGIVIADIIIFSISQ